MDVKILSRVLAQRLQLTITLIINKDQNAFIRGHNIGENILDVYSLVATAEEHEEEDILIFLDIEKAYDTVSWRFLSAVLEKLDFPDSFVRWVEILHRNKDLRIYNNGFGSDPIKPNKGLAQGCPLSPLLFIIAISRLAEVLSKNNKIKGIKCANTEKKCCMAADDTVIAARGSDKNLKEIIRVLQAFYVDSGLKINYDKSSIVRIGKWKDKNKTFRNGKDFVWLSQDEKLRYLGILLTGEGHSGLVENVLLLSTCDIVKATQGLRYQHVSLIGKVLLLRSLINSKIVYKLLHYPSPHIIILKKLDKLFYDYIWRGRHRINKACMEQPVVRGGLNMINVFDQNFSLKCRWLAQALQESVDKAFWEIHLQACIRIPLKDFLRCNLTSQSMKKLLKGVDCFPEFWFRLFKEWFSRSYVRRLYKDNLINEEMFNKGLLFNSKLGRSSYNFFAYEWLKERGCFTFEEVKQIWEFLTVNEHDNLLRNFNYKVRKDIVTFMEDQDINVSSNNQSLFNVIMKPNCRTKQIYLFVIEKKFLLPIQKISKWERDLESNLRHNWLFLCKKSCLLFTPNLKAFHIQFLNRAFNLNTAAFHYTDCSKMCSFCGQEPETYYHFFWTCNVTKANWEKLISFCEEYVCTKKDIMNVYNCLLSNFSSSLLVNVTVIFKRYLFMCKMDNDKPSFKEFLCSLKVFRNKQFKRFKFLKNEEWYYKTWDTLECDEVFNSHFY